MPRPRKAFVINGTPYTEAEAREIFDNGYYQMQRYMRGGAVDYRLTSVTIGGITYESTKQAQIALGVTKRQLRQLYPQNRTGLFPAEINGTVYGSWQEARDALGWCRSKVYAYAQKAVRHG